METVMIVICITQMIVNVLLYALVLQNDDRTKRRMQKQRTELLDLIHAHQQWIEITQREVQRKPLVRQSTTTQGGRTLLQEEKKD